MLFRYSRSVDGSHGPDRTEKVEPVDNPLRIVVGRGPFQAAVVVEASDVVTITLV